MPPLRLAFWAATAGGALFVVRSVLRPPPPLLAFAVLTAYVGLFLAGVFLLRLRIFADALVRGPHAARGVVLTFDDGPDPATTPRVLEALARHEAVATFFVIGKKAEAHPDMIRDMQRRGHTIGLHSYEHDRLFSLRSPARIRRDLTRGLAVLTSITGERPRLFRPPIGHTQPSMMKVVDALDLETVGWSVSARDGFQGVDDRKVLARLRSGLEDGAILLLHDAAERGTHEPATVRVLERLLDAVHEKRLEIVPLERFLPTGTLSGGREEA